MYADHRKLRTTELYQLIMCFILLFSMSIMLSKCDLCLLYWYLRLFYFGFWGINIEHMWLNGYVFFYIHSCLPPCKQQLIWRSKSLLYYFVVQKIWVNCPSYSPPFFFFFFLPLHPASFWRPTDLPKALLQRKGFITCLFFISLSISANKWTNNQGWDIPASSSCSSYQ